MTSGFPTRHTILFLLKKIEYQIVEKIGPVGTNNKKGFNENR
jgi:hypothetical protein